MEESTKDQGIEKQVALIKQQVSKAEAAATALVIKKPVDLDTATALLGKIKTVGKMITAQKESITKPLNLALKNVRLMFAPIDMGYGKAEEIVKEKMIAYQEAEEEKAAAKTKVIEEKVEAGTITPEKAFAKVEAITPKKNVTTATGAAQFRMVKEVEVEDETKVPREYMLLDMVKIRKVALAGVAIPGVRVFEKKVVAGIVK